MRAGYPPDMAGDNCGRDPCAKPTDDPCAADDPCNPRLSGEASYQRSLGVRLQATVDRARLIKDRLGMRPYRVWIVYQERAPRRDWREVYRQELRCEVVDLTEVRRELGENGNFGTGGVRITEVSPAQVSEATLRGQLPPGTQWGGDTHDREMFFEIQRMRRCPGDPENPRHRFVLGSEVHHDAENFQFTFTLLAQQVPRGPGGVDRSLNLDKPRRSATIVS